MMNLVLFGAPGSGKGTQSAKIIDKYGLYHISTGDVLRDHIARHTDLGRLADKYISKGQLIPDAVMTEILDNVLEEKAGGKNGVVFDGFPRTIAQAEALEKLLKKRGGDNDVNQPKHPERKRGLLSGCFCLPGAYRKRGEV